MKDRMIKVNNPAVWRPVLSNVDAVTAYILCMEASLVFREHSTWPQKTTR